MKPIPSSVENFAFGNLKFQALLPDASWLQQQFDNGNAPGMYWAQVWPAAKALCEIIAGTPSLAANKNVLEIAAGLGLPSLLSAKFAASVMATDYIPAAVELMEQSARLNQYSNLRCRVLDWNNCLPDPGIDLLLLSDINYDPSSFEVLYNLLNGFIANGTAVLLSTPQRLMAKDFMQRLLHWQKEIHEVSIQHNSHTVYVSVWLLKK